VIFAAKAAGRVGFLCLLCTPYRPRQWLHMVCIPCQQQPSSPAHHTGHVNGCRWCVSLSAAALRPCTSYRPSQWQHTVPSCRITLLSQLLSQARLNATLLHLICCIAVLYLPHITGLCARPQGTGPVRIVSSAHCGQWEFYLMVLLRLAISDSMIYA